MLTRSRGRQKRHSLHSRELKQVRMGCNVDAFGEDSGKNDINVQKEKIFHFPSNLVKLQAIIWRKLLHINDNGNKNISGFIMMTSSTLRI